MRTIAAVFIAVSVAGACAAQSDALLAPLPIRDQFLLNNSFFFFVPEQAAVLPRDHTVVALTMTDSNTFAKSAWLTRSLEGQTTRTTAPDELANPRFHSGAPVFLVDGEARRIELSVRHGFGRHLELGVAVPVSTMGGGWSDELIEVTHHTLGIGNDERDSLTRNLETIYLQSGKLLYVRERSDGFALGDIAVTGKYELVQLEGHDVAISLSGAVELPTGNARTIAGSGSLDAGLEVIASRDFSNMRIHASVGLLRLGSNHPLGTPAQVLITDTVAISRKINARTAATVQLTVSESPLRRLGIAEFNRRSNQLSAGIRREIGRSLIVYAALIENLFNYENSADAGIAWGLLKQF
ncbi:MAG TPA: DUF3187 family protein [Thermoanaerobaculia bacterium]|nr:DUF3187 family protein [Thermoanaerobaculia bacterium]